MLIYVIPELFQVHYVIISDRDAANEAVSGEGKLERLIVASHCVAAGTAQLVVASRVKASRNSDNLAELSQASREVTNATATVVATAKSCAQLVQQSGKHIHLQYFQILN